MERVCDGRYEYIGKRGMHGTRSTDVEDSHHPSNPILNGKIWMLNDSDDGLSSLVSPVLYDLGNQIDVLVSISTSHLCDHLWAELH